MLLNWKKKVVKNYLYFYLLTILFISRQQCRQVQFVQANINDNYCCYEVNEGEWIKKLQVLMTGNHLELVLQDWSFVMRMLLKLWKTQCAIKIGLNFCSNNCIIRQIENFWLCFSIQINADSMRIIALQSTLYSYRESMQMQFLGSVKYSWICLTGFNTLSIDTNEGLWLEKMVWHMIEGVLIFNATLFFIGLHHLIKIIRLDYQKND